jgi:hypothetical protein
MNRKHTKNIVEELRTKKSRDNRELLDRAADRIEELEKANKENVKKILDDIERLLYANRLETHTGVYYREELKDSFDILKRLYTERAGRV